MAVFDFLKKKEMAPPSPPGSMRPMSSTPPTPVDYVRDMRAQGYADAQIVEALRQQNYPETMIMDAMNQAEIKGPEVQPQPALMQQWQPKEEPDKSSFEEIAESIVDEKAKEIRAIIDRRKDWEESVNIDLTKLKQEITDIKNDLNNLHKAIVSKISDYDQNLLSVGTEIKAMEKVFQKILPDLTQSVNELSRMTEAKKK